MISKLGTIGLQRRIFDASAEPFDKRFTVSDPFDADGGRKSVTKEDASVLDPEMNGEFAISF